MSRALTAGVSGRAGSRSGRRRGRSTRLAV